MSSHIDWWLSEDSQPEVSTAKKRKTVEEEKINEIRMIEKEVRDN